MKLLSKFLLIVGAAFALPTVAHAQDDGGQQEAERGVSFTITPRYQHLLFKPSFEADGLETLPSYGASVAVRTGDGRFGLMATYMTGDGEGTYTVEDTNFNGTPFSSTYDFEASREEIQLTAEYTPRNTNISILAGYHRFSAGNSEVLTNPSAPGNSEIGNYDVSIDAFEFGMRLSSALGEGSRHSISAQFVFGVGNGQFTRNLDEVFGGVRTTDVIDENGTGYLADVALGYNFFITNNIAIGARARAYVFYVDVDAEEVDPIFAIAPEANISIRF